MLLTKFQGKKLVPPQPLAHFKCSEYAPQNMFWFWIFVELKSMILENLPIYLTELIDWAWSVIFVKQIQSCLQFKAIHGVAVATFKTKKKIKLVEICIDYQFKRRYNYSK